jgi:rod shape-determining protein MreB
MKIPTGLSHLILKLHGVIYIALSPDRLIVRSVGTPYQYDDVPHIGFTAEKPERNPSRLIFAVGYESKHAVDLTPGSTLCQPFYHPRLLVSDYYAAQVILDFAIRTTCKSVLALEQRERFRPFFIIHPTVQYEDGLTRMEFHILRELGHDLRASRTYIWTGKRLLTDDEILSGQFPYNGWNGKAPWWQQAP